MADLVRRERHSLSRFAQTVKRLSHIGLGICHPYHLDDSTCHLRAVLFHFDSISNITSCKRTVVPDQTPRIEERGV